MMKRNNKKRGFTIIELTIVVAVIAILSAVLIPTFAGIIKKARQSADQQAVTSINTALAGEVVDKPENIAEVIALMAENGYDVEDYKPLTKDTYFYWVKSKNAIVIADNNDTVLYPVQYEGLEYAMGDWYTLTGEIEEDNSWEDNVTAAGEATVSSGEQLVSLMKEVSEGKADEVKSVTLSGAIDVKGSTMNFGKVTSDLTISGSNDAVIYGLRSDQNNVFGSGEYEKKGYYYGIIPNVASNANVTVKDIIIDGMIVEDSANENTGTMGFIAGNVSGNLTIDNVTVINSTISGGTRVGALVGHIQGGSVTIKNSTIKDNTIKGSSNIAVLVGTVMYNSAITLTNNEISGNTVVSKLADGCTATANPAITDDSGNTTNAADTFMVDSGFSNTAYVWAATTQNYYWYQGNITSHWSTRNYDACIFSANTNKATNESPAN